MGGLPLPMFVTTTVPSFTTTTSSNNNNNLKEPGRIRNVFPETWLWTNASTG